MEPLSRRHQTARFSTLTLFTDTHTAGVCRQRRRRQQRRRERCRLREQLARRPWRGDDEDGDADRERVGVRPEGCGSSVGTRVPGLPRGPRIPGGWVCALVVFETPDLLRTCEGDGDGEKRSKTR